MLFDRYHQSRTARASSDSFRIKRLDRMDVQNIAFESLLREQIRSGQCVAGHDSARDQCHARSGLRTHWYRLADLETVIRAADDRIATLAEPYVDRSRPVQRLIHESAHFVRIADRNHGHVRQRAHYRDILNSQMSRAERRVYQPAAISDETNRQIVQTEIERDLLITTPGDERRDCMDKRDVPFHRKTRCHPNHVGFAHTFHEGAARHLACHPGRDVGAQVGSEVENVRVAFSQFKHHVDAGLAHYALSSAAYRSRMTSAFMLDL